MTEHRPIVRGIHLTEDERRRVCMKAIDGLDCMRWAHFWIRIYRDKLYRESGYGRAIERKMEARKSAANKQAWRLARMYGIDSISQHELEHGRVLEWNTPSWRDVPYGAEARGLRAYARQRWWMFHQASFAHCREHNGRYTEIADRWHAHWKFINAAVRHLGLKSWPLSERDIARTKRYVQSNHENQEMDRIRAEVRREEEQAEAAAAEKRRKKEVKREAQEMVAEIVPGARSRRLMSKAHGFDALIKLLESSNVDDKTKDAIGRLRAAVEGERPAPRRLPSPSSSPADVGNSGRYPGRRAGGLSATDG